VPGEYSTRPPVLPLPPEDTHGSRKYWKKEVDAAVERLNDFKPDWDRNVLSYRAKSLSTMPTSDTVVVPRDFAFVEQKAAQLFFQTPEIHLKTDLEALKDAVTIFQPVLNHYLSEDEVNALAMMNEVVFDALCPSGLMCSKIGWEAFEEGPPIPMQVGEEPAEPPAPSLGQPDPNQLPGSVLGLGAPAPPPPMRPIMAPTPNIVWDRYFWERISPAQILIPHNFSGSVYDKAHWLGFRFEEDWEIIKKKYKLADDMDIPTSRLSDAELKLKGESVSSPSRAPTQRVTGCEIWYRTALYDPKTAHPEKMRQLVLIDGYDEPLLHRDSPYQSTSPSGTLIGMIGFPIHIGALRYVSDSAYPPSECSISRSTNEELNRSRTQMMLQRDRSIPMRFADLSRIGGEAGLEKIRKNIFQQIVALESYDPNNPPVGIISLAQFPRENFTFNDYLDRDLEQVWAMGANQRGQESAKSLTATEISKIDQWANSRLDKERRNALTYYIRGTRKLGSLVQLFITDEQVTQIVGQDKLQRIQAWDREAIPNAYAYSANPDSAIRIDQAQARTQILKLYELLAKDPNVNRTELLTEICRQWNLDPARIVVQQLPPKGPDPAAVSFRFGAEDLDVLNPNFPMYVAILEQAGYKLTEPDPATGLSPIQAAQQKATQQQQIMGMAGGVGAEGGGADTGPTPSSRPPTQSEHGGTAPKADRLNKHQGDQTGQLPGPHPLPH